VAVAVARSQDTPEAYVVMEVSTSTGAQVYFIDPAAAAQVAEQLAGAAKDAQGSGLVTPPRPKLVTP
jgi:hypothetical protein